MIRRVLFPFLVLAAAVAAGAELDLFVTDYNEDAKPDQKPLAARPVTYGNPQEVTIKTSDGKAVSYKAPGSVTVQRAAEGAVREARLFACPGEYEPFSFLLRPKQSLEEVFILTSELKSEGGAIPAENIVVTSVEHFLGEGRDILMELGRKWNMAAQSTEYFWCTIHVPRDAKPGTYKGEVKVTAKEGAVGSIAVVLEVLPIALEDPPFALGYNYTSPKDAGQLAVHLADMRRHGMTCVAPLYDFHLPVHDTDTKELAAFIAAYKKAGFPATLYFATPMNLQLSELAGFGNETNRRWQQKYIKTMKLLHAEAQKGGIPVLFSIGDELTNKGIEGIKIAGNLARFVWEEFPEIATTSDMNGYMEVMAMAPWLNVATFNNGWDGIDHHNKGRTLMNKAFLEELQQKTGAIPWFVNAGTGRFPFGFFFWKMAKLGVRGKVEWYYNLRNERGSVVRTHEDIVYPTLDYERSREGIDDLKYVCKLEALVAVAKKAGKADAERKAAEELLTKLAASIEDNWSAYTGGGAKFPADGFDLLDPEKAAALGGFDALRRAIADQIVALQSALK